MLVVTLLQDGTKRFSHLQRKIEEVLTAQKLATSDYVRISQTPYINTKITGSKKKKAIKKPTRCPYTLDFLEARADCERPSAILPDLFTH